MPSRRYWASLQLTRRAVPFNPLIHLTASRRHPLAQRLPRRLWEAQKPRIQSLPPKLHSRHKYSVFQRRPSSVAKMSGLASKQQSLKIFEKLKTKPANKVRAAICNALLAYTRKLITTATNMELLYSPASLADFARPHRSVSIADRRTQHGHPYLWASTSALTAPRTIETSVSTSPLFDLPTSTVSISCEPHTSGAADRGVEWQWDQLRVMKVGGNESATKFFQQNGGTAALNSKDPKTKYQSNAATKYKEELKKRAARDAQEYVGNAPLVSVLSID